MSFNEENFDSAWTQVRTELSFQILDKNPSIHKVKFLANSFSDIWLNIRLKVKEQFTFGFPYFKTDILGKNVSLEIALWCTVN